MGLSDGIRLLIKNGFFNEPKPMAKIKEELEKEGYFYRGEAIDKLVRHDFMKKKKILTRIKKNTKWHYVIRK